MEWKDIAAIVFACTAINHLGLVTAVEQLVRHHLPVVNCPKCLTFWSTLVLGLSGDGIMSANPSGVVQWLAISFLASYSAIWLELIMYSIDTIYNRIYDKISKYTPEESDGETADGGSGTD
ncbi:MAG: hypothetical protein IJ615_10680 [Bacteroidaceae bacterium]|nr:hypothetical protein [Bacteroidaceae bacterium]